MADPPLLMGGDHSTVAVALPPFAFTLVGAPGTVAGVTVVVAAGPVPAEFRADTDSVYAVPFVKPVKWQVSAVVVHLAPVGDEVTL